MTETQANSAGASGNSLPPPTDEVAPESGPPERERGCPALRVGRALDVVTALVLLAAVIVNHPGFYNDDLWITFRYAQNLVSGHGLVFNPGEWVLATTAPAYAIALALLSLPLGDVRMAGLVLGWLGFVAMGGGLYLLFEHMRRGAGFCAFVAAGLCAIDGAMKYQFGMESHLATGLGFLIVYLHVSGRRPYLLGTLMALMLLMRPDAVFLGAVVALSAFLNWRVPWRALIPFAAIVGIWALWAWPTYGSPVPHSVGAKYELGQASTAQFQFVTELLGRFYSWYWGRWNLLWIAIVGLIGGLVRCRPVPAILFGWISLHFLAFAVARVENMDWYYIPIFAVLYFGISLWLFWPVEAARWVWLPVLMRLLVLGGAVWVLTLVVEWHPSFRSELMGTLSPTAASYQTIAEYLEENAPEGSTLAAAEIGVLGHFAPHVRILDLRGLVTPEALDHIGRSDFTWWNRRPTLPDYVVLHRPAWPSEGAPVAFMLENYEEVLSTRIHQLFRRSPLAFGEVSDEELRDLRDEAIQAGDATLLRRIAMRFYARRNFEDFLEALIGVYRMNPPTAEQLADLMTLLRQQPADQLREGWLRDIAEMVIGLEAPEETLRLAQLSYNRGLFDLATRLYARARELQPEDPELLLGLARCQWRLGQFEEAEETLTPLLEDPTWGVWAHRTMALVSEAQGDLPAAIQHWEVCRDAQSDELTQEALREIARLRARLP